MVVTFLRLFNNSMRRVCSVIPRFRSATKNFVHIALFWQRGVLFVEMHCLQMRTKAFID